MNSQLKLLRNVFIKNRINLFSAYSTDQPNKPPSEAVGESQSINRAMKAYMERAKEHETFLVEKKAEFQLGRRHLANMMGRDPENFTQKDIDEAIRYLFPSGLFNQKARPVMRPPEEIYPKHKVAAFDASGRPHHPLFYTSQPNFFYLLHQIIEKFKILNRPGSVGNQIVENNHFAGTNWVSKEELEKRLTELITDSQYEEWTKSMDRLSTHCEISKELDFVRAYRKAIASVNVLDELPQVVLEADGTQSVTVKNCRKKHVRGEVTVRMPGSGRFIINDHEGLDFFKMNQTRETVIFPLTRVGWLGKVDVEGKFSGVGMGESSIGIAYRFGIAVGIAALGAPVEMLRLAGLLQQDWRTKERKKIGHQGSRRPFTWKKR